MWFPKRNLSVILFIVCNFFSFTIHLRFFALSFHTIRWGFGHIRCTVKLCDIAFAGVRLSASYFSYRDSTSCINHIICTQKAKFLCTYSFYIAPASFARKRKSIINPYSENTLIKCDSVRYDYVRAAPNENSFSIDIFVRTADRRVTCIHSKCHSFVWE